MSHFAFHNLNHRGKEKAEQIKALFEQLVIDLNKHMTGDERYKALTMTKLEEACFYSKKGMATDEKNQEQTVGI